MTTARLFKGVLPDGQEVLIHLWPEGGAEIAFRAEPNPAVTWSPPTALVEETS